MAISYASIIDRAFRVANMVGQDANNSLTIDNQVVLEDLAPLALREAIIQKAGTDSENGGIKRSHALTFVNGTATLPDTVIEECLDTSSLVSTTDDDITQLSSYQPRYLDFQRPAHNQLSYFTVQGRNILFRDSFGDPGEYNGAISLVAVSMPAVVAITADLGIGTDVAESAIKILAAKLRGPNIQ
jgi:hypothetical protein